MKHQKTCKTNLQQPFEKKIIINILKYPLLKYLKMGFNIEIEDAFEKFSLSKGQVSTQHLQ